MIYRHYKGGLYYYMGVATRSSSELPTSQTKVAMAKYTEAVYNHEKEPIPVWVVDGDIFTYQSDFIDGVQVLYRDLKGQYWLRPIEMWYEDVNGEPRFKKVRGEELFDMISKQVG